MKSTLGFFVFLHSATDEFQQNIISQLTVYYNTMNLSFIVLHSLSDHTMYAFLNDEYCKLIVLSLHFCLIFVGY